MLFHRYEIQFASLTPNVIFVTIASNYSFLTWVLKIIRLGFRWVLWDRFGFESQINSRWIILSYIACQIIGKMTYGIVPMCGGHERYQQRGRSGARQEPVLQQARGRVTQRGVPHQRALHEGQQVCGTARGQPRPGRRHVADTTHRLTPPYIIIHPHLYIVTTH